MLNFDIRLREGRKKGDLKWIRVYNKRLLLPQKNAAHEIKIGMAKCAACTCLFFVPLRVCLWGTQRFRFAAFCCYFASHIGFNAYQKKREIIRLAGQFCWAVLIVRATHKTCKKCFCTQLTFNRSMQVMQFAAAVLRCAALLLLLPLNK